MIIEWTFIRENGMIVVIPLIEARKMFPDRIFPVFNSEQDAKDFLK